MLNSGMKPSQWIWQMQNSDLSSIITIMRFFNKLNSVSSVYSCYSQIDPEATVNLLVSLFHGQAMPSSLSNDLYISNLLSLKNFYTSRSGLNFFRIIFKQVPGFIDQQLLKDLLQLECDLQFTDENIGLLRIGLPVDFREQFGVHV